MNPPLDNVLSEAGLSLQATAVVMCSGTEWNFSVVVHSRTPHHPTLKTTSLQNIKCTRHTTSINLKKNQCETANVKLVVSGSGSTCSRVSDVAASCHEPNRKLFQIGLFRTPPFHAPFYLSTTPSHREALFSFTPLHLYKSHDNYLWKII